MSNLSPPRPAAKKLKILTTDTGGGGCRSKEIGAGSRLCTQCDNLAVKRDAQITACLVDSERFCSASPLAGIIHVARHYHVVLS